MRALGLCGLVKRELLPDVDIGYAFLREFWGQGYAREAAGAVVNYARSILHLKRLVAIVTPENERSVHMLTKLGLAFEAMITWPADGTTLKLYAIEL